MGTMHQDQISKLEELGYNQDLELFRKESLPDDLQPARVVAEHRERYMVRTAGGEYEAEITGNMRFTAAGREDFPAVGDWVGVIIYDSGPAIIHRIFPRSTAIKRKAAGQSGEMQVIAANIDCAFLVQAIDRDFSINRLERYLTLCHSAGVKPVVVLTKTDLAREEDVKTFMVRFKSRLKDIPMVAVSNETGSGYTELEKLIEKGKTYCMLGSSGVGKSTLLNKLVGKDFMKTGAISLSTGRGKHVTSHRELTVLGNGGILIDNPGMREVGLGEAAGGLEATFDQIASLAAECRFKDCTHTSEAGCAVTEALGKGLLNRAAYENFLKMEREKRHYETTIAEKRKKEKMFGKILKDYQKKDIKNKRGH